MKKVALYVTALCVIFSCAAFGLTGCSKTQTGETGSRVVAGDAVTLEILDYLGVNIVGVPDGAEEVLDGKYADEEKYPRVGNAMGMDEEAAYLLDPSEVVVTRTAEDAFGNVVSPLESLGITVHLADYNTIPNLKETILDLGTYFGKEEEAQRLLSELAEKEAPILAEISAMEEKPSALVLFGAPMGESSIMVESANAYGGSLVSYIGAVNVETEVANDSRGQYRPNDWEPYVSAQPDYILCIAHGDPEAVWAVYDSMWTNLPWTYSRAVKEGRIYYLPSEQVNVNATLNYAEDLQYLLDIFNGEIESSYGG